MAREVQKKAHTSLEDIFQEAVKKDVQHNSNHLSSVEMIYEWHKANPSS